VVARSNSAYGAFLDIQLICIQATIIGETGWWQNQGQFQAINDPNGHFSLQDGSMSIPYATTGGYPVVFNGGIGVQRIVYGPTVNGNQYRSELNPINFGSSAFSNTTNDYAFSDVTITNNLLVAGPSSFASDLYAGNQNFHVNSSSISLQSMQVNHTFTGSANPDVYKTAPSAVMDTQWQTAFVAYYNFDYENSFSPDISYFGNHPIFWHGASTPHGFGGNTNGVFITTGGYSAVGTNQITTTMGANGFTNTTGSDIEIVDVASGNSLWISNTVTPFQIYHVNLGTSGYHTYTIRNNWALIGSGINYAGTNYSK
jgi:hypothetical protein